MGKRKWDLWDSFVRSVIIIHVYINETIPAYEVQLQEEADSNEAIMVQIS